MIGENGLNVIARDSSFELFGNVGLYYIMFLAGLEMNMSDFKSIRGKAIVFGLLGFVIPMALGCLVNSMVLQYAAIPSMLIASMYASHTLVSYPIVSRYGVSRQLSVSVAVGATAITDSLTLFLLAIIGGLYKGSGEGNWDWLWLVVKVAALSALVIYFFPVLGVGSSGVTATACCSSFCACVDVFVGRHDENRRNGRHSWRIYGRLGVEPSDSHRFAFDAQFGVCRQRLVYPVFSDWRGNVD